MLVGFPLYHSLQTHFYCVILYSRSTPLVAAGGAHVDVTTWTNVTNSAGKKGKSFVQVCYSGWELCVDYIIQHLIFSGDMSRECDNLAACMLEGEMSTGSCQLAFCLYPAVCRLLPACLLHSSSSVCTVKARKMTAF